MAPRSPPSPPAPRIFNNQVHLNEILGIKQRSDAQSFVEEIATNPYKFGVSRVNLDDCTRALDHFLFFNSVTFP